MAAADRSPLGPSRSPPSVIVAGSWNKPEQSPEPYAAQAVVELGFARKLLARLPIRGTCLVV
ncbi:MAG TPA: hypothetical protein VGP63_04470, partial [Planctomycetaceae bacterium]|nr:hypothetical protein [Planctomycetaceae bacterium]